MRRRAELWAMPALAALLAGGPALPAQKLDDPTIVSNINARLFADSVLKACDIRVTSESGVVTLEGTVATELEKAAADRIASTEPGVRKVVDSMMVKADAPPPPHPPEARPGPLTVGAGTVVTIRMIDAIDSARNRAGQEFDASVDAAIAVGNQVAIPKDSPAKVRLVDIAPPGRIKGSAQLMLELVSITVNGAPCRVESGYYELHGASRGRNTARAVSGGAVLGAMIGGIAGGGAGAAIGAGSGAAVGGGVAASRRGPVIRVPSETRIDFTLRRPVSVSPAS